jgi:hypothetical protein
MPIRACVPDLTWAAKLPEGIPRLEERLSFMRAPIDTLQRFLQQVKGFGGTGPSSAGKYRRTREGRKGTAPVVKKPLAEFRVPVK